MKKTPQVAIVIVSYNTRELLLECVASVIAWQANFDMEIVVVDNASQDGSLEAVRRTYPQALTIANEKNLGFGAACNQAINSTLNPFIVLLNSDARLMPETLLALYDCLRLNARCGAARCQVVNAQGQEVANTRYFLNPFNQALELMGLNKVLHSRYFCRTQHPQLDKGLSDYTVDWIDGACLMLRREALDEVGLFDDRFFMYSEDEDLCYRLKKRGWSICFSKAGRVVHQGGGPQAQKKKPERFCHFYTSQMLFLQKHKGQTKVWFYKLAMKMALIFKRLLLSGAQQSDEYNERLIAFKRACVSRVKTSLKVPRARVLK